MKNKGFSLVELLVAMTIMLWLLMMTTYTFQRITHRAKDSTSTIGTEVEQLSGLELLRLDLEHAGFGLAEKVLDGTVWKDLESLPIEWKKANKELIIKSSLKNADPTQNTLGWALATCESGLPSTIDVEQRKEPILDSLWIDSNGRYIGTGKNPPSCPTGENLVLIGYPYAGTAPATGQPYSTVEYKLKNTGSNPIDICHSNTGTLIRTAKDTDGTSSEMPVLNCVAGITAKFTVLNDPDEDVEGDEEIITNVDEIKPTANTVEAVRKRLLATDIYILTQVGKEDPTYRFPSTQADSTGGVFKFKVDGTDIEFDTKFSSADEFQHFRWKVIKVSAPLQGK